MSGEMQTCFEFFMASKIVAPEHSNNNNAAGFSLRSSSVWPTVKAQRDNIESWGAKMVANVIGVKKPQWMEMDQWWRHWHRTGLRWIEKCNMNVLTAIRERALSWAGHLARLDYKEICAKALRCQGLQWWRWRQVHRKEVEKDKWSGPQPQRSKIYRWEDMVATEVSKFTQTVCRNQSRTTRDGCILLKTVEAGNSFRNVEEHCIDGLKCLGDPCASGMTGTDAGATGMAWMAWMVVASMASMASMAWMDLTAPELNVGILELSLQLAAIPRENDGSRSLRRVVRIGGMRAEGSCKIGGERSEVLLFKIGEERVDGLRCKFVGKIDAGKNRGRIGEERADGFY